MALADAIMKLCLLDELVGGVGGVAAVASSNGAAERESLFTATFAL